MDSQSLPFNSINIISQKSLYNVKYQGGHFLDKIMHFFVSNLHLLFVCFNHYSLRIDIIFMDSLLLDLEQSSGPNEHAFRELQILVHEGWASELKH